MVQYLGLAEGLLKLTLVASLVRVFDKHNVLQKQHFDYRYMCFDQDFLEMLTLKEEAGMIFWFRVRPSCTCSILVFAQSPSKLDHHLK